MYIVADIGGTKTRVAASADLESFGEPVILDTPQNYEDGLKQIREVVQRISGGTVEKIVAGEPGGPNLPDWKGRSFDTDLASLVGAPVHLENDTALVGLGEAAYGAGKGVPIVVYITVSTGVNGVRVVDGAIDRSRWGFEIGGQYLSTGDTPQTLEELVSGKAISERFKVASPRELGKDHLVWEELARTLAFGVHNTILHWSPDRVVLGGSMFNEIGIKVDRVEAHVRNIMKKFPDVPEIVHSSLGDVGGLWGGLARLKQLNP